MSTPKAIKDTTLFSPLLMIYVWEELITDDYNVEIVIDKLFNNEEFKKQLWQRTIALYSLDRLKELDEDDRAFGAFIRRSAREALTEVAQQLAENQDLLQNAMENDGY